MIRKRLLAMAVKSAWVMFLANLFLQLPFFHSGFGSLGAHDFSDEGILSGGTQRPVLLGQADGNDDADSDCQEEPEEAESDCEDSDCDSDCDCDCDCDCDEPEAD